MQVDIWSDINCPWCAIGRARFGEAIAGLAWRDEITVEWRPFELDPSAPAGGSDLREAIGRKYGRTREQVDAMQQGLVELGVEVGVVFDWDRVQRRNTFACHQLLTWAVTQYGPVAQDALKGRLLTAHFAEGLAVDDYHVLARLADEIGLDGSDALAVLETGLLEDMVRAEEARGRALGITAVPTFVIDDRFTVPGAQDPDTLRLYLERARDRAS